MGYSLGNFGGQLSLEEQNQAQQNVGAASTMPSYSNQDVSHATQQGLSGWEQTQKYLGAAQSLNSDKDKKSSGLGKIIGIVGALL